VASLSGSTAVSIPTTSEQEGLDELLASYGFEYVDARAETSSRTIDMESGAHHVCVCVYLTHSYAEIPGLPRVLDALSTIMWPSMVQAPRAAARRSRPANFLGLADDTFDEAGLAALLRGRGADGDGAKELAELEKWLEEDEPSFVDDEDEEVQIPVRQDFEDGLPTPGPRTHGFDDDFAAFVSAPSSDSDKARPAVPAFVVHSGHDSLSLDTSFDATYNFDGASSPFLAPSRGASGSDAGRVSPGHTDASWTSLGSTSEAGEVLARGIVSSGPEDEDVALPSRAEVLSTSARIFGPAGITGSVGETENPEAFDLTRVLASLEGMKAEIASIEDDDQRRQAAAKVALGLVHGLGLDKE
jgi:hypothetical protein